MACRVSLSRFLFALPCCSLIGTIFDLRFFVLHTIPIVSINWRRAVLFCCSFQLFEYFAIRRQWFQLSTHYPFCSTVCVFPLIYSFRHFSFVSGLIWNLEFYLCFSHFNFTQLLYLESLSLSNCLSLSHFLFRSICYFVAVCICIS